MSTATSQTHALTGSLSTSSTVILAPHRFASISKLETPVEVPGSGGSEWSSISRRCCFTRFLHGKRRMVTKREFSHLCLALTAVAITFSDTLPQSRWLRSLLS
ncbi:hypothetical protein OE88DRAFT_1664969 [Heliocybe sulcata]|uniref:Uncharacterized protein n=1 Tax=Heliocybe sulcata TaxID=5364 RepID=A0A5C3MT67_9AGAM|nr:hypothetical protein OE88DRAFT_1664969 [Heliocybe sulcata]